jgi:DNA-binding transcriptional ArsR family regulator
MSNYAQAWAWSQGKRKIGAPQLLILVALADYCDDEGVCWPGTRKLSEKCGLTQRSIRAHIQWLEDNKLVERVERTHESGRRLSNLYRLPIPIRKNPSASPLDDLDDPEESFRDEEEEYDRDDPAANFQTIEPSYKEPSLKKPKEEPLLIKGRPTASPVSFYKEQIRQRTKVNERIGVILDMVETLTGTKRQGGQAAALLKAYKDPEQAVQILFEACTNPTVQGNPIRYALGAGKSSENQTMTAAELVSRYSPPPL